MRQYRISILLLLLVMGCAKQYALPAEGEPAATISIRLGYDHANVVASFPPDSFDRRISIEISLDDQGTTYRLASKNITENLDRAEAPPLDRMVLRVHPGRSAVFSVQLGAAWKTSSMEYVTKEERKPRQVMKQERVYNAMTRTYESQTRMVTEYETEKKQVLENVTRSQFAGCAAKVSFLPERDRSYLLDYANPNLTEGCTLNVHLQAPQPDGSVQLIRVN